MEQKSLDETFVKFHKDIMTTYSLSHVQTLIYWAISRTLEVFECCFMSSKEIGNRVNCSPNTVNNTITKFRKLWLFDIVNGYYAGSMKKYRRIYEKGCAPTQKEDTITDIDMLFYDFENLFDTQDGKDEKWIKSILGSLHYTNKWSIERISEWLIEQLEHMERWELISIWELREWIYACEGCESKLNY